MRKALRFVMSGLLVFALAACGTAVNEQSQGSGEGKQETSSEQKTVKLGLTQFVSHPALDAVREGIVDGLADKGYVEGKNLEIDFQNAHAEMPNTVSIAQKFAGDKKDMVIAIATPSAQAVAQVITDIPVVFSTVTDPVSANLVKSLDKPDKNITGTSDKVPMDQQIDLIKAFVPDLKQLGVIYTTSEVNAEVQVQQLEEFGKAKGVEIVKAGISNSSEVQVGAQTILDKVQAILIPIDNTVVSSVESVLIAAQKANVPVFASDMDTVKKGAVATNGIDYYQMGVQTGEMAARILDGQKVADTPVEVSRETELIINEKAAAQFGLTIPEELKARAKEIIR